MTAKVVIDVSMSLDGYIAGPNDGQQYPLGERGGEHIFDWYFSGRIPYAGNAMFKPEGSNVQVVAEAFADFGCMLTGRRTYDITQGWNGEHPVNAIPVVVLTHRIPENPPRGKSELIFVTDGIERAVVLAQRAAKTGHVGIGGASAAQQALRAGLVDEVYVHVAPILLGAGVRLFEHFGDRAIELEPISTLAGPHVTHLRYRVRN